MKRRAPTILISCGEISGDLHASFLVKELLRRFPNASIMAFGGEEVGRAGADLLFHFKDYSVLGFSDVLANLPRFFKLEKSLKKKIASGVDLFIPVDYPGLNLRLASYAKKKGVPVLYYISPQIWAWGRSRLKMIQNSVDYMAFILPFEKNLYQNIRSEFVGHPFIEDHALPPPVSQSERSGIGLLPGSRKPEVERVLPVLLKAALEISRLKEGVRFSIGMAPSIQESVYGRIVDSVGVPALLHENAQDVMRNSELLLVASGSATLQVALFESPLIIVYKVSPLNYLLAKRLVKIENIGLVNIVLGEKVCREFIQGEARPKVIAQHAIELLDNAGARDAMIGKFRKLRGMLSGNGGCRRVAEIAGELIFSGNRMEAAGK